MITDLDGSDRTTPSHDPAAVILPYAVAGLAAAASVRVRPQLQHELRVAAEPGRTRLQPELLE